MFTNKVNFHLILSDSVFLTNNILLFNKTDNYRIYQLLKKIMSVWNEVGMNYFWGDLFDVRFFIINLIKKDKVERILDLGCGVGIISHFVNADLKIGLELQEKSIREAKKLNPKMELIRGDIRFLPFQNDVFPKILSIHSLSSMSTPEQ